MKKIHNSLIRVQIKYRFFTWLILTALGTVGGISYFFSAPINGVVFLFSLVMAVLYMFRRVPETRWYKFWAVVWSIMIIPCIWKLIPFVGWLLAIVDIVLFWHLHFIARRDRQPQPKSNRQHHYRSTTATGSLFNVRSYLKRKVSQPDTVRIGDTTWHFYHEDDTGVVAEFTPRTWCGFIPEFWRKISVVKEANGVLSLYEKRWFQMKQATELRYLNDPDHVNNLGNWFISLIFRNEQLKLDFATRDGIEYIKFRVWRDEADAVVSAFKILIQEAASLQKVTRLGH